MLSTLTFGMVAVMFAPTAYKAVSVAYAFVKAHVGA